MFFCHCPVMRDLFHGVRTRKKIAHAAEAQIEALDGFVEDILQLFGGLPLGDS
jgi:hypothetical protein